MYEGGTCINIGCIPTKTLLVTAEKVLSTDEVMATKNTVTTRPNGKNYATIAGTGVDIIDADSLLFLIKSSKIQAEWWKTRTNNETIVINTELLFQMYYQSQVLLQVKHVFDSTK